MRRSSGHVYQPAAIGRRYRVACAPGRIKRRPRADEIGAAVTQHLVAMSTTFLTPASAEARHEAFRDGRPAPRWATIAAHLVALVTLPSGLWRIGLAFGFSMGMLDHGVVAHVHGWESVYIVGLSIVTEAAALLTLALVQPWGERLPRSMPVLGGRRVPPRPVVAVAAIGALFLAVTWAFAFRDFPTMGEIEFTSTAWHVVMLACYLPLLLWAPLLAAVTYAYWRRRCRD